MVAGGIEHQMEVDNGVSTHHGLGGSNAADSEEAILRGTYDEEQEVYLLVHSFSSCLLQHGNKKNNKTVKLLLNFGLMV